MIMDQALEEEAMMKTVQGLLDSKNSEVFFIQKGATVFEAIVLMDEKNIGSLLVKDGENVVGIVTERDYMRKIIIKGRASKTTPVRDIMTSQLAIVAPELTITEAMAIMSEKHCRHLPIFDGRRFMGLVSMGDLSRELSKEHEMTIMYLRDYITGSYPQ